MSHHIGDNRLVTRGLKNKALNVPAFNVDLSNLTRSYCLLLSLLRPELVVKKLRYYARYIVVCLLLNKMDLVKVLVKVRRHVSF